MATSPRYHLAWPVGPSNLLVVSVGTGFAASTHPNLKGRRINLIFQAQNLVKVIMNGSSVENDRLCRVLGQSRWGGTIDGEFNATEVEESPAVAPLFSYVRYNADISERGLREAGLGHIDPKVVAKLDAVRAIDDLTAVGRMAGGQVSAEHFAGFER
jgi:hypothetical protein